MTDYERINAVSKHINMSFPRMAESVGLKSPQTFYDIKKGKNKLSKELALKIAERYPEISITWLLTGEGDMLRTTEGGGEVLQTNEHGDNLYQSNKTEGGGSADETLRDVILRQSDQIDRLLTIIERMQAEK